jgi:hypothetical protein
MGSDVLTMDFGEKKFIFDQDASWPTTRRERGAWTRHVTLESDGMLGNSTGPQVRLMRAVRQQLCGCHYRAMSNTSLVGS